MVVIVVVRRMVTGIGNVYVGNGKKGCIIIIIITTRIVSHSLKVSMLHELTLII